MSAPSGASEPKLTKKNKKALAFRSKGKGKPTLPDQDEVPEAEDLETEEKEENSVKADGEGKTKKRKRDVAEVVEEKEVAKDAVVEGEGERKKKRQRGKKKSEQRAAKVEEGKSRLILFVGNLPFKVTVEQITAHFASCGEVPIVRLLTPKPNPLATVAKTKGCAFLEFTLSPSLQSALRLHESEMGGRKINVELSAGGGGNSDIRKKKLSEGRKRMDEEREKTKKNKEAREGGVGGEKDKSARWKKAETEKAAGEKEAEGEKTVVNGVKKVRDRRIKKVDSEGVVKERARKAVAKRLASTSGANSIMIS